MAIFLFHFLETRGRVFCRVVCGLALLATVFSVWASSETVAKGPARISVLIVTGMPGGAYYHVGVALASMWTTRLQEQGIRVSAAVSEGSRENIHAIRIADADIILAEEFLCSMAYRGTGLYKGQPLPELRSVTALWPDAAHVLIREDRVQTGTIQDLAGLTMATGLPESGDRITAEILVRSMKQGKARTRLRYLSPLAGAEALKKGAVQALDLTGGLPMALVTNLFHERKPPLRLLEVTDEQLDAIRSEGWSHVFRLDIPAGVYPSQDKPVRTIGHRTMLAGAASLDPQVVYELTRSLYENLDQLVRAHPACRNISLEKALEGLEVPLHPGAVRYFEERGVIIPERLLP